MVRQLSLTDAKQDVAEASRTRPDLVLVLDGMYLPVEQMDAVRAMGIRTAVWMTDDPYYTDMTIGWVHHYDYVFTLEFNCVAHYQNLGRAQVHYLPFAHFPAIIVRSSNLERQPAISVLSVQPTRSGFSSLSPLWIN